MASKLSVYNGALRILKERRLTSLTENREPLRLLDAAWRDGATEGSVRYCLELGQWTFATRTVQIDYSPSVTTPFGYRYAFDQPTDMVRVAGIYSDEYLQTPLLQYSDERRYWYCDLQTIFVAYVSNHASYGADLSLWPESFTKMVEAHLAAEIAGNLTQGESKIGVAEDAFARAKKVALSMDAMAKPTRMLPQGEWNLSRRGFGLGRYGNSY